MIQKGSKGAGVVEVQGMLTMLNYSPGPVDGIYGDKTEKAVMQFQVDYGLAVDGIVGPKTLAALKARAATVGGTAGDTVTVDATTSVAQQALQSGALFASKPVVIASQPKLLTAVTGSTARGTLAATVSSLNWPLIGGLAAAGVGALVLAGILTRKR